LRPFFNDFLVDFGSNEPCPRTPETYGLDFHMTQKPRRIRDDRHHVKKGLVITGMGDSSGVSRYPLPLATGNARIPGTYSRKEQ